MMRCDGGSCVGGVGSVEEGEGKFEYRRSEVQGRKKRWYDWKESGEVGSARLMCA